MTIRITLEKGEWVGWNGKTVAARTQVQEFADHNEAASWFVEDSYFAEPYTLRAVYEVID